jgi:hypothetical protein
MSVLADYTHPGPVRRLLKSLVPVVCPPLATEFGLADAIVDHVELSMRASSKGVRVALLTGISGYELAAALVPRHLGQSASSLSVEDARRYFGSWWSSPLPPQREFAKGVKGLLCLACYEQPQMMEAIGYTPNEWIDKSTHYRLRTYSEAIAKREVELFTDDPLPGVVPKRPATSTNSK